METRYLVSLPPAERAAEISRDVLRRSSSDLGRLLRPLESALPKPAKSRGTLSGSAYPMKPGNWDPDLEL